MALEEGLILLEKIFKSHTVVSKLEADFSPAANCFLASMPCILNMTEKLQRRQIIWDFRPCISYAPWNHYKGERGPCSRLLFLLFVSFPSFPALGRQHVLMCGKSLLVFRPVSQMSSLEQERMAHACFLEAQGAAWFCEQNDLILHIEEPPSCCQEFRYPWCTNRQENGNRKNNSTLLHKLPSHQSKC